MLILRRKVAARDDRHFHCLEKARSDSHNVTGHVLIRPGHIAGYINVEVDSSAAQQTEKQERSRLHAWQAFQSRKNLLVKSAALLRVVTAAEIERKLNDVVIVHSSIERLQVSQAADKQPCADEQ